MAVFEYKAMSEDGKAIAGVIDANTAREARDKLRENRIHVVEMLESKGARGKKAAAFRPFQSRYTSQISMYTRQLSTLLASGMPIAEALNALIEQIEHKPIETAFRDIREQILQGSSFGEALEKYPLYFSDLYVNMVKAGEASGEIDGILRRLADYLAMQNRIRSRVVAALAYPIVLVSIAITVVIFLLTFVVPKILDLLKKQQGSALPLPTQILVTVNEIIIGYWWLILLVIVSFVAAVRLFLASERGAMMWDRFVLKIPLFGSLIKKRSVAQFAITFAALLRSGIPALDALKIVRSVVRNRVLAETIREVHDRVLEGADISLPIKRSKFFPPMVGYMIATGEKSGELPEILERLASAYDEEVELAVQKIMSLVEPVIIVFLAFVVGGIILSVILPILQLSKSLGGG
jgi:general secretion pathway protein F